ncbi:hypothetical protein Tco_0620689 [Tanacetum coccineum]
MSEAEPIPPTSSVTALRIPMIKKGEYDLWSMKMRQYIAITDHILWDIITMEYQAHVCILLLNYWGQPGLMNWSFMIFTTIEASMPTTHDDEDLLLMMRVAMKKLTSDGMCRFAKYQENRANGHKEKKIVAIEDSNSKALVATDNNEEN